MPGTPHDAWPSTDALNATADEVAKQAIQDAARHEEQLVKLALFSDDRALRVLAVYVPVLVALATAAIALQQSGKLTLYVGLMIGGATLSLFVGCLLAITVLWTTPIFLPSRKPEFWKWALDHDCTLNTVAKAYIDQSIATVDHNHGVCGRSTGRLMKAYACGVAAPFVGAALVWQAYWAL